MEENIDLEKLSILINKAKSQNFHDELKIVSNLNTINIEVIQNSLKDLFSHISDLCISHLCQNMNLDQTNFDSNLNSLEKKIFAITDIIKMQLKEIGNDFKITVRNIKLLDLWMEKMENKFVSYFFPYKNKQKEIESKIYKELKKDKSKYDKEVHLGDKRPKVEYKKRQKNIAKNDSNISKIEELNEVEETNSIEEIEKDNHIKETVMKNTNKNITKEKDTEKADTSKVLLPNTVTTQEFQVIKEMPERLSDVKGMTEIKDEIAEIVNMLKNPDVYQNAGAKMVRGILLMGKPGTGKTLLARALAGETNINFIFCNGADFDKTYVGQGSNAIRKLFKTARKNQPCIIFIDEIDSLLHKGRRSGKYSSSNDRSLINTFLSEMDGFNKRDHIFVMGATNSEKDLDKAATRPGRFDKLINVPLPDSKGREELFDFYIGKVRIFLIRQI